MANNYRSYRSKRICENYEIKYVRGLYNLEDMNKVLEYHKLLNFFKKNLKI